MKFLIITLLSMSVLAIGENMNILEKLIFQEQYKNHILKGGNKVSPTDCVAEFNKAKEKYLELGCSGEGKLIEAAMISGEKFTTTEIDNMPAGHPHLKSAIRGTNKYLNHATFSGKPSFPHSNQACEKFFDESVEVVEIDGKKCREITFSSQEIPYESYTQTYCADSLSVFISFK